MRHRTLLTALLALLIVAGYPSLAPAGPAGAEARQQRPAFRAPNQQGPRLQRPPQKGSPSQPYAFGVNYTARFPAKVPVEAVSQRASLGRPEVAVRHRLVVGRPDSLFTYGGCKNQVLLELGNVAADTRVEVLRQVPRQNGAAPRWQSLGPSTVTQSPGKGGRHTIAIHAAVPPHTPLKIVVQRPSESKTHVVRTAMPAWTGDQYPSNGFSPFGRFHGAEEVWRTKAPTWIAPETVQRTVAHAGRDGTPQVRVHGRHTAPASSTVTIVNEATGC